jgi:phosphoribosylamine--glycine ligase
MKMKNILLIGSGGREHSLALKIAESRKAGRIYAIPGNPGISALAECHSLNIMDNSLLLHFAKQNKIDLVVVGPEDPLANGIADALEKEGIKVFGPRQAGARLESSKAFAREFMKKHGLPTVEHAAFTEFDKAREYIIRKGAPIVVKADGLAAGKGVLVAQTEEEAINFSKQCLKDNKFGKASSAVVIEECLFGEEVSYLVFTDGETFKPMVYSQDHKQVFDNDKGANTGGMGAYSPAPILDGFEEEIETKIMKPFLKGIKEEKIDYRGVLYVGLMKTKQGLKILEFNCRFGDPETQVILPRMKTDLVEVMEAVADRKLGSIKLEWSEKHCVCVVLASKGYPEAYEKGKKITGLENLDNSVAIYAGVSRNESGLVTNGGRVLGVVSLGETLAAAVNTAYSDIKKINFEGMHYRKDIAGKELKRQK